jgi:Uma2 family endonuclease
VPVTIDTFRRVALEDDEAQWELVCGRLVRRPAMTMPHNEVAGALFYELRSQLDPARYHVRSQAGHVRTADGYRVPDVCVIPADLTARYRGSAALEEYAEPLPFVAEVWSRSTGDYDVEMKFREYRARGDLEIWRVHPYDRTVTAWRRASDGSYDETLVTGGSVALSGLAGVVIDLERVFAGL